MSWTKLLANGDIQRHRTSKQELDDLRSLIARDLADADVISLSTDRRFATAYNAALQAANMAIVSSGYRLTAKTGHHRISFDSVKLALGPAAANYTDYFETCRRKHNVIDYTHSNVATDTETDELVRKAREFYELVERWIGTK